MLTTSFKIQELDEHEIITYKYVRESTFNL